MNIKPLSNNVLVEYIEEEQKTTKSGIVLPDNAQKKERMQGIIVATGPGKTNDNGTRISLSVKTGDKVLFSKPWSDEKKLEDNGKKYYIISEDEILAVVE
ncbi:MAG: co-chaperone GroES [Patescibacteria group bacterium]